VKGWRSAGPFFVREHTAVENYWMPFGCRLDAAVYYCAMTVLKPNGISHSVLPDKPMTYNEWMQYIHAQNQSK